MLDPKALASLSDALEQVISQIGDDPKFAHLVDALTSAREAAMQDPEASAHDGEDPASEADPNAPKDDPYSFDHAQSKLTESRSGATA